MPLEAKISDISANQQLTVSFNQEIYVPDDPSAFDGTMELSILYSNGTKGKLKYSVSEVLPGSLTLDLSFEDLIVISAAEADQVEI